MEDTVSVLIWEEAMDMTDWARLLLAGSVEEEVRGGDRTMTITEHVQCPLLGPQRVVDKGPCCPLQKKKGLG